jgi:hypothetical protein
MQGLVVLPQRQVPDTVITDRGLLELQVRSIILSAGLKRRCNQDIQYLMLCEIIVEYLAAAAPGGDLHAAAVSAAW